jgi:hypothetical protein
LELVDNPRDLRWEITSRAVGWDLLREKLKSKKPVAIINAGAEDTLDIISEERRLTFGEPGFLRPKTRWNLQKVLKFRDQSAPLLMSQKAGDYMVRLMYICCKRFENPVGLGSFTGHASCVQRYREGGTGRSG